jgi:transposase
MSLPPERVQRSFCDAVLAAGELFPPGDRYRVFREKVLPVLRKARSRMAKLYCANNGRPAVEPVVAMGASMLQYLEKLPDRLAAAGVRLNLGWKYALDLEVDDPGFDPSSLSRFRTRLVEHEEERLAFDAVLAELREAGLVKRKARQRLDSTHVLGLVAAMSRLDVVWQTLRGAVETLREAAGVLALEGWGRLMELYVETEPDWRGLTKEELAGKFQQAGRDAHGLLSWLEEQQSPLGELEAVVLLRRVFGEQFEFGPDGPVRRKGEPSGAVKNPHDPDAQWSTKDQDGKKAWVGYKAQIAETVPDDDEPKPQGEPTEQFLTDLTTTEAIASDLDGMGRSLEAQAAAGQEPPPELYVDAGYVTDDTLAQAKAEGRQLIGPAHPCPHKEGLLPADQFDVDLAARRATCPAGKTSTQCSHIHDADQGATYWRFEWGAQCDACPLCTACTRSRTGRRILAVGEHHDLLQARRREMKTPDFYHRMHRRNAIEGTVSELVRLGLRRTRYRGLAKTRLHGYLVGAACNVGRWLRLEAWRRRAKARAS